MRDKFSELIKQGVAEFKYTNISKDVPEQDPICRMYNNIFSIPSDTHMSCLEDGRRVITGHMINTDNWGKFLMSCCWGAVNFITSGTWSVYDFLYRHNLEGRIGTLNGDIVYFVTPIPEEKRKAQMNAQVVTNESNIPMPITALTTTGDMMHIKECFDCDDVRETVRRMNESTRVKGNNWVPTETGVAGLIGNKVYIIGNAVNEANGKHQIFTMSTVEYNDGMKVTVFDHRWDKLHIFNITRTGKVDDRDKWGDTFLDNLNKNIKGFDWTKDLEYDYGYSISCDLRLSNGELNYTKKGPWYIEGYKDYEVDTTYFKGGNLKKRR